MKIPKKKKKLLVPLKKPKALLCWNTTLTEVFPCFFLSCKENARVKLAKTGHGPHSSKLVVICVVLLVFVLFYILFVCKCVLYYCQRMSTQLQLTNVSYLITVLETAEITMPTVS